MVSWLDKISVDAEEIFLLGDLFDFWFEYKRVVPKGFVRVLGKLAQISDSGIPIHIFTGNHDMWLFDYLPEEIGAKIHHQNVSREFAGIKFYIGHGDGMGPGDYGYKFIKKVFANSFCQWLFAKIHPDLGMAIAHYWSGKSRISQGRADETFLGNDKEWLVIYAREILKTSPVNYFIFGHRHLPLDIPLSANSRFINLGDWVNHFSYAVFDGKDLRLEYFK